MIAGLALAVSTLAIPVADAAFTGQTSNAGNSIAAAAKFHPEGLAHYWPLDGTAIDGTGTADGTINGATTIIGDVGDALSFDEVDDYVVFPDIAYGPDFTLTFAFKIDDNDGPLFMYAYSHGDVNSAHSVNVFFSEARHGTDPNVVRTVVRDGDDTLDNVALQADISSLIGDGQWHTYALVVDSSAGLTVFVDGAAVATDPTRGTGGIDPAGPVSLGAQESLHPNRFFGGGLDELQIYDRVLTPAELAALAA